MVDQILERDIENYLERVGQAGLFDEGSLLDRLLEHLLRTELVGEGESLKAYAIGLDVLNKPESFDPSSDSSVRVAMGRLRTALALFEGGEFADTTLLVNIPVGTYRPEIGLRERSADMLPDGVLGDIAPRRLVSRTVWLAAAAGIGLLVGGVLFFQGGQQTEALPTDDTVAIEIDRFRGDPQLADQVSFSLRRSLSRNRAITVVSDATPGEVGAETDLVLRGRAAWSAKGLAQVSVELVSVATDTIVWATSSEYENDSVLKEQVAQTLANELRIRAFGASKLDLADRDPETLSPEQLFIMATWVPGPAVNAVTWELERIRLMGIALAKDPDFGSAHSVMADKLAYLANVYGPSNTAELRDAALDHAQSARELSPLNPDVMFNVAQALWHSGKVSYSEAAMLRVLELDPGHDLARFLSRMIPHTCSTPPEEVIEWAIAFDEGLSPDNPIRWLTLTWISWLHVNRGDYTGALGFEERAALIFEIPYSFMRHAMLLTKLGRADKAAELIAYQKKNWPDIDPAHFAEVTWPRLCSEDDDHPQLIQDYQELADALKNRE